MAPATPLGRVLGGVVAIVGIGPLALFSGLITVGFLDQLRIRKEQAAAGAEKICPRCGRALAHEASSGDAFAESR